MALQEVFRWLLFYVFLNVLIVSFLSFYCANFEYSWFYKPNAQALEEKETRRLNSSLAYLSELRKMNFTFKNAMDRRYCVGMMTTKRVNANYVVQSTASILYAMSDNDRSNANFLVLNGEVDNDQVQMVAPFVEV